MHQRANDVAIILGIILSFFFSLSELPALRPLSQAVEVGPEPELVRGRCGPAGARAWRLACGLALSLSWGVLVLALEVKVSPRIRAQQNSTHVHRS